MNDTKIPRTVFLAAAIIAVVSTPSFAAEYYLRADVTTKTMPDGQVIPMWGFALENSTFTAGTQATVPGPTLTVPPGDTTLTIHLKNNLTAANVGLSYGCPVCIVIPNQVAPMTPVRFGPMPYPQFEGRIRSLTHETPPDNATIVDYVWNNVKPGSYVYHSGTHIQCHVQMGLYGAVVKDYAETPYRQAYPNIIYEDSVMLFFSEIDPAFHTAVDSNDYGPGKSMTSTIDYEPKYFLVNGEPFAQGQVPLPAGSSGGGTLLRIFNMGLKTRAPLLQGSYLTLVAEDGLPYAYPREQYVASLPAAKTIDAMVVFPAAGTYPIFDRMLGLVNAMAGPGGMLRYLTVTTGTFWPVIHAVTAAPTAISDTQSSQLEVVATDVDTASLTYAWDAPAGAITNPTSATPFFTPPFVAGPETYTLTVTVSDGTHVDIDTVEVAVEPTVLPPEVIVDNLSPATSHVGVWLASGSPGFWATDSVWSRSDGGSFTFPADLNPEFTYAVYAWWTQWPSRHTAVPYQIKDGGALLDTVTVNQQVNGGTWNLLGLYTFSGLAEISVLATPGSTVSTSADAVRFVPMVLQSIEITGPLTVNDQSTENYDALAHFWGGPSQTVEPQMWSVDVPGATIGAAGVLTTPDVTGDTPALITAQYSLNGKIVQATYNVTIIDTGGPIIESLSEVIVDNRDAGTSSVGTWGASGAPGFWGTDSVWSRTDGGRFTFTAAPAPGTTYQVYAWWTQWPSRYTAVPYQISDGGTLLGTVNVDQQVDGGQWNLLGTYTFTGSPSVSVLATPGAWSTSADAVRFVPAP